MASKAKTVAAPQEDGTITYRVRGMRILRPSAAVAERNPDLLFTVVGKFETLDGRVLTIPQKQVTTAMRDTGLVGVDLATETLTLPAGKRGRPVRESADQSEVDALLADLAI